ncbi:DNA-directed RNA polymerase III subunit RPC4 [Diaphorina citri]|uniref:DNA-directed RNA polymerase III subunit RPC4 n=1 Tax=Diaphorina citri TaxID=121845 RepID=A0A3Q0J6J5_DIACI|nr:DNA-directed RNA polymerase III subunit RPC4 [Diaphorina citri]XP_026682584.1 DNA-directed RNA polymerase III subunit RPC4 [Diaphorina citri]
MSEKSNGQQAGPSSSSVQRLPTWKPPRDLSLASISSNLKASVNPAPKKQFMPNLNVQRKKNAEPTTSAKTKKDLVNTKQEKPKFTGKKKDSKGLIQTTSVFSEGIAASEKKKSSWGSYRDSEKESKANLPPPKLNLERNKTVDKSVDEETLQTLLRDDFIDDGDDKSDIKDRKAPIQLPLLKVEPKSEEDKKVIGGSSERLSQMLAECDHVSDGDVPNKFLFFQVSLNFVFLFNQT